MKYFLLTIVFAALSASSSALECWGTGIGKTCMGIGNTVDTNNCAEVQCTGKDQKCVRYNLLGADTKLTTQLNGCLEKKFPETYYETYLQTNSWCDKILIIDKQTTCYCDTDKCNGTSAVATSLVAILLALTSSVFLH